MRVPFGCGEQNMITLAPNVAAVKYLAATGKLASDVKKRAADNVADNNDAPTTSSAAPHGLSPKVQNFETLRMSTFCIFFIIFDRRDLRIRLSGANFDAEDDFEVR